MLKTMFKIYLKFIKNYKHGGDCFDFISDKISAAGMQPSINYAE